MAATGVLLVLVAPALEPVGAQVQRTTASAQRARLSLDALVEQLRSSDPSARRDALLEGARLQRPELAGAISALAADPDPSLQSAAIGALVLLTTSPSQAADQRRTATVEELSELPRIAFEREARPARPVPFVAFGHLAAALRSPSLPVRERALYALALLSSSPASPVPSDVLAEIVAALSALLEASEPSLRLASARTTGRLLAAPRSGPPPVPSALLPALAEQLISMMNRPEPAGQLAAIDALGRARESRALEALNERLAFHRAQGPVEMAIATLEALGRLAHPDSAAGVQALSTDSWTQNGQGYLALMFARARVLGDAESAGRLQTALQAPHLAAGARRYLDELASPR